MRSRPGRTVLAAVLAAVGLVGPPVLAQEPPAPSEIAPLSPGGTPLTSPGGTPLVSPGGTPLMSPGGTPLASPADSIQLVYDREVFSYPGYDRRNPFRPLTGEASVGPRFEDLVLMGRIMSTNAASSIALIGASTPGSRGGAPSRTYRLRVGDVLGNTRLLEIRDRSVVLDVEEFGLREARVLELRRTFSVPERAVATPVAPEGAVELEPTPPADPVENAAPDAARANTASNGNGGWS